MEHLQVFAASQVYAFVLVFARAGTAVLLLPAFSEQAIPTNIRLVMSLAVSFMVMPLAPVAGLAPPADVAGLAGTVSIECLAGAFLGASARIVFSTLHVAGQLAGQSMGLTSLVSSPGAGFEGAASVTNLFMMSGGVMIFATGLHIVMIQAIIGTYGVMPMGEVPDLARIADDMAHLASRAFTLSVQFASPFLVLAFLFNLGLGLTNRMMQSLPVFFIGTPFMLAGGLFLLMVCAGSILVAFVNELGDWLHGMAG